jgi:hypothetical protein
MQQPKRKYVIFVDISKTTVITFISKFYSKNLYAIDKKKEFVEYLSNVFDARRWNRGSVKFIKENLVPQSLPQLVNTLILFY